MSKGFYPNFSITNQITQGLTRIERARGFLDAASLSDEWLREMERRALILEAHHTTHIEGTHLTLDQAALILARMQNFYLCLFFPSTKLHEVTLKERRCNYKGMMFVQKTNLDKDDIGLFFSSLCVS